MIRYLLCISFLIFFSTGCASLRNMVKSKAGTSKKVSKKTKTSRRATSFKNTPNFQVSNIPRQYRRMTNKQFEKEARIQPNEGSLWVMEGQESYLFTQNQRRLMGDVVNVGLDGQARSELEIKARSIEELLRKKQEKIDAAKKRRLRAPAAGNRAPAGQQAQNPGTPGAGPTVPVQTLQKKESSSPFNVDMVQTRIIEQFPDGSYRVKGSRSFMIGKKEFRVLVTGVAKGSDIQGDQVNSTKLLDPKFDIVRAAGTL